MLLTLNNNFYNIEYLSHVYFPPFGLKILFVVDVEIKLLDMYCHNLQKKDKVLMVFQQLVCLFEIIILELSDL